MSGIFPERRDRYNRLITNISTNDFNLITGIPQLKSLINQYNIKPNLLFNKEFFISKLNYMYNTNYRSSIFNEFVSYQEILARYKERMLGKKHLERLLIQRVDYIARASYLRPGFGDHCQKILFEY
jgi:hypothetical protein